MNCVLVEKLCVIHALLGGSKFSTYGHSDCSSIAKFTDVKLLQ